jgi:hypothetical protein
MAHQLIIGDVDKINEWKSRNDDKFMINTKINTVTKEPYFFKLDISDVFLIQNVKDASLSRAVNVARVWKERYVNTGWDCPEIVLDDKVTDLIQFINPYTSWGINDNVSEQYNIIRYSENVFAAALFVRK